MIRDDGQVICTAPLQMNKTTKLQTTFTPNKEGSYLRESIIIIFFFVYTIKKASIYDGCQSEESIERT